MVITSSILFYQMEKKCRIDRKKAPSDKLQIKNIRIYDGGATSVGSLYLVDATKYHRPISVRKPVSLIFINAEKQDEDYFPSNCDYAVITDIKSITTLFEKVSDSINELQEWDCRLKDGLNFRYPLNEYVPIANEIINEQIYVLNRNLSLLSFSDFAGGKQTANLSDNIPGLQNSELSDIKKTGPIGHALSMEQANELLMDDEYHGTRVETDTYVFTDSFDHEYICLNIFSETRYIARLMSPVKKYGDDTDEGQLQLFRHFFKYFKQIYLRYSEDPLIKNNEDKLHVLIRSLIFEPSAVDSINASLVLQNYGWNSNHKYVVIKFSFFKNAKWDELTEYISGKLEETWSNSCAIRNDDEIVWVINHSINKSVKDERKFFHVLAYIVRDFVCKAGVSDTFCGIEKFPSYLLQANTALKIGQKCDPDKWYFKFSDYALDYMFDRIVSEFDIEQLIYAGIRKLIDYDEKNETDFLDTLRCYLYNNCNSTHTAEELFIHRTTLIRRIDRIEEISGIDFQDRDMHIYLIISFWILEKLGFKFDKNL